MDNKTTLNSYFLKHGGDSSEIIKAVEWSKNPLGPIDNWPNNLKNTLATLLSSKFPMFLWWGNDLIQFYNDAYRPSLGNDGKHPNAMGQKAAECWPEIWNFIHPLIIKVMTTGESVWYENMLLPIYRNGKLEDAYWTFSYSPVLGDNHTIEGVLVVCNETTQMILHNLHLQENKEQSEFSIDAAELGTFDLNPITNKFKANNRLKSWFGLNPDDEIPLNLATDVIAKEDHDSVVKAINDALKYELGGKYEIEYTIIHPISKEKKIVRAKGRAYFNENNQPYQLNGTLQDITKYVTTNEEIIKARQLTDLTIKSMGMGLFNIDFANNTIDYSPEFAVIISGSKSKNLTRKDFVKHIHPDDLALRETALQNGMESGSFFYSPRVIWDDGTIHRITISGTSVFDNNKKPIAFIGTVIDITEQEKNEIALQKAETDIANLKKESDALFRNVTDSSPTGLWLSDKQGLLTYLNLTLIEWTGMSYPDLLGTGWTKAIIKEDRQNTAATFQAAINAKSHYDVLFQLRKGTGEIVWCRAAGDPFYDENGEYAGYAGFCMDVDEIISGRKALSQSEERFSLMIEQAPVGICLFTGLEMKIEIANNLMCKYWGRNKSVIGQKLEDAVPELKGQPFLKILEQVYTTGETYEANSVPAQILVNGKLTTIYFDFTYKPIRDYNGNIYGIMDIALDVTEKVFASQKLEETRIALAGAIELAELANWSLHIPTQTFTFSHRFMSWIGFTEATKSAKESYLLIPVEDRDDVIEKIEKSINSKTGVYDNEHSVLNNLTGQIRIIHSAAQVFYDADGNPEYLTGTAQDVTKEKKLQEELKYKVKERTIELRNANQELEINNQELQQFAYIASHDLQEPVRKIKVFMQMLETYLDEDPEKVKYYIEKINNASTRMTALIRDVLGFSQLATTAKVFEKVNLNQVTKDILANFDLKIEEKKAKISFDNLPTIEANYLQMSQLFDNIISNALKYSKSDVSPEITITSKVLSQKEKSNLKLVDTDSDYFKIEITDNGIGFDQQYSDKIFNIFQRLHGKEDYGGTGIGLAMCRKIVQNHNGEIKAMSKEGIGTTFTLILPKSHS